jgi:hypothetical protein
VTDRLVRFPGRSRHQIEALPEQQRLAVQRVIFHLLTEPVPTLADPDRLPGANELRLPSAA